MNYALPCPCNTVLNTKFYRLTKNEPKIVDWRNFFILIKLMSLYSVNVFKDNSVFCFIFYLLIILISLNQSDLINFNFITYHIKNVLELQQYLYSWICSVRHKSGLQVGLFLRIYTTVISKSISNSCNIKYLVQYKSKYEAQ